MHFLDRVCSTRLVVHIMIVGHRLTYLCASHKYSVIQVHINYGTWAMHPTVTARHDTPRPASSSAHHRTEAPVLPLSLPFARSSLPFSLAPRTFLAPSLYRHSSQWHHQWRRRRRLQQRQRQQLLGSSGSGCSGSSRRASGRSRQARHVRRVTAGTSRQAGHGRHVTSGGSRQA
eukprot:SAG11_NODE_4810_length_1758_cov_3.628692_1_plen_173_part_01